VWQQGKYPKDRQVFTLKYSANLKLPFNTDLRGVTVRECDTTKLGHFHATSKQLPPQLLAWLSARGVYVPHAEVFHTPAMGYLPIHVDGERLCNIVKLNWCYGKVGSMMNWFKLKDASKAIPMKETVVGTKYLQPLPVDCQLVHSARISGPTLVNVGVPHSIINFTNESRWTFSAVLWLESRALEWDEAMQLFKDVL
jgi:hypothetical protein